MTAELTTAKDSKLMYNEKAIPFIIYQGSIWLQLETCVPMSKENWKKYIVLDGGEPNAYFETPKSPEFLISKFDDGVQGWTLTKARIL
mgnify:CR=1 FL=1